MEISHTIRLELAPAPMKKYSTSKGAVYGPICLSLVSHVDPNRSTSGANSERQDEDGMACAQGKWKSCNEIAYRLMTESSAQHFRAEKFHSISPVPIQQIDIPESEDGRLLPWKTDEGLKLFQGK